MTKEKQEKGQSLLEYALIIILVAIVVIIIIYLFGPWLQTQYTNIIQSI